MIRFTRPVGLMLIVMFMCAQAEAASAQSADVLTLIKARKTAAENGALPPARPIPETVPYSYVVTLGIESDEDKAGDDDLGAEERGAVSVRYRMNPMAAPGSRVTLLTGAMEDYSKDIREQIERYNSKMSAAEIAEGFWCEDNEAGPFDSEIDVSAITVISETEDQAHLSIGKGLASALMDSDDGMPKKLLKRLAIEAVVSKPDLTIRSMHVKLTKPVTLKIVAKIKEMDMRQSCEAAPNGLLYVNRKTARVAGKALGIRFRENMSETITDLRPVDAPSDPVDAPTDNGQ